MTQHRVTFMGFWVEERYLTMALHTKTKDNINEFILTKKWATHGLFFIYFRPFKHTIEFYNKSM